MTAFVILAAGRGTRIGRVGESLHKALVPLAGKAIISHQIERARSFADRVIIATGHRADQIKDYVSLAHPTLNVTFVDVDGWDKPGGGPGASLLQCEADVGDDDMLFTSCDTLWDDVYLPCDHSWSAVAPIPAGTPSERWCQMAFKDNYIIDIIDKKTTDQDVMAYTGMSYITHEDLGLFWFGLKHFATGYPGELEISRGLSQLLGGKLQALRINWTDVGDEESYRHAIAAESGFDWVKLGQATYVLPSPDKRVVKFHENTEVIKQRVERATQLRDIIAHPIDVSKTGCMIGYPYTPGEVMYAALDNLNNSPEGIMRKFLKFYQDNLYVSMNQFKGNAEHVAIDFYRNKTFQRVMSLPRDMQSRALDAITCIDWYALAEGTIPGRWHGDLNMGNVIYTAPSKFTLIDWREDFAGETMYGDIRYDLGKLMAGCVVHWSNAQRGDFRPWTLERPLLNMIQDFMRELEMAASTRYHIELIAALSLLNCAPLHAAPLDEVLVSRGIKWLERLQ